MHRRDVYKRQVQGLVSSFNAKYPDIKVTVEYLDYTNGDDQVNTCLLYTSSEYRVAAAEKAAQG